MNEKFYQKCVICNKIIKPLYDDETFDSEHLDSNIWVNGVVENVYSGYGSKHDGTIFLITICDECLENNKNIKKVKEDF